MVEEKVMRKVKTIIRKNISDHYCGIFFTHNTVNDKMRRLYADDNIAIDVCDSWSYFEVFGLTEDEQREITLYYRELRNEVLK